MIPIYLSLGAFLAAALVLPSFMFFWRERNIPALSLIAWIFVMNVIYAINSIVWMHSVHVSAPVWCDITTKLQTGMILAILIANACISRQFEAIASGRILHWTSRDYRRRRILELAVCVAVPILYMILHIIIQPHRFDIIEDLGCHPAILPSIPAIFIVYLPPFLISAVTLLYFGVAMSHIFSKRLAFSSHLSSASSSEHTMMLRLTGMTVTQLVWCLSILSLSVHIRLRNRLQPWHSWASSHANFYHIEVYHLSEFSPRELRATFVFWWTIPVLGYIFFLFNILNEDTMKRCSTTLGWIRRVVFRRSTKTHNSVIDVGTRKGHIIVHKMSTIDIRSDVDDGHALPRYHLSTPGYAPSIDPVRFPRPQSCQSIASSNTCSMHSLPRIVISEEFPASRPPTPPLHYSPSLRARSSDMCTQ